ncbi:hypothetical protein G6F57_016502 [Rhizopus arrhizus]|nr:hypothetical protein G6F57_016502 [Rhizopus arrhizus]
MAVAQEGGGAGFGAGGRNFQEDQRGTAFQANHFNLQAGQLLGLGPVLHQGDRLFHVAVLHPIGVEHRRLVGNADVVDQLRDDLAVPLVIDELAELGAVHLKLRLHGLIRAFYACAGVGFFLHYVGYLAGLRKCGKPIGCAHVVTDTVSTDGNAGRGGQNHKEIHVVPWFVVLRALVLMMGIAGAHAAELIDINRADAQALQQGLTMVGATKAEAIVEHRRRHGPFHRVEDLTQVKGIGKAIVERNRQRITVGNRLLPADPVPGSVPVRTVPRR